jgi:glycosyltransferase involved in cell wall biosynthesis
MIAIVYPQFYGVGGIARYLDSFLANLPADHPAVYLITGDEGRALRSYQAVEIIHIPFQSNRFSLIFWSLAARRLLRQLFADGKIKVVNFHFPPLIPGLFLPRDIPMVLTAHTTYRGMSGHFYTEQHFKSPWNPLALSIKYLMEQVIFSYAAKVITLTEQGRAEVSTYHVSKPVAVIPNGVDLDQFVPDTAIKKDIDVLFCGRIEKRKGSRPMVEICKRMVRVQPNIRICIVGYGDDDIYVKESLAGIPNITLAGKVPFADMVRYYNRSKVYASASYYEGLPGTCLEAMAMQLPTVVWEFKFYEHLVIRGKTGYAVPPNDYDAFVSKLQLVLGDLHLREGMGINGRALLQRDYNWSKLSADLLKVMMP